MDNAPEPISETLVFDSHVHFWDPTRLEYPWLEGHPTLRRPFLPADYSRGMESVSVGGILVVEGNPLPEQAFDEVTFIEGLAEADPRISGIVAFVNLPDAVRLPEALDRLVGRPLVRGVRHNIQGNAPGFAIHPDFVAGVCEVGGRGLTFDLCLTHDQLSDAIALVRQAPGVRFVLDHCGKPAIRLGLWEPWATQVRELAALPNVGCKISGLLTEADPKEWSREEILRYARHVVTSFGKDRVIFGSDWPVVTLADRSMEWYSMARELTGGWTSEERGRFFSGNARKFYRM
jgi:L-fuconolactonase